MTGTRLINRRFYSRSHSHQVALRLTSKLKANASNPDKPKSYVESSKSEINSTSKKLLKLKKSKYTYLAGAHKEHPRSFESIQSYRDFYSKFVDTNKNTFNMFNITTITHKSSDFSHPMLMLTNREGARYFFGKIPEGSQRLLNENRFKLAKMHSVFLTGTLTSWSEIGGLPGLFLTISDATKNNVEVFANCSKIASYIVATWRYFVFRQGVQLKIDSVDEGKFLADNTMILNPIKIESEATYNGRSTNDFISNKIYRQLKKLVSLMFPVDTSKVNDPNPNSYKSDPSELDIHTHVELPHLNDLQNPDLQPSLNYLIRFLPVRGKFNPAAAIALGIKPGKQFKLLANGENITNDNGELVESHQVLEPQQNFRKVLILDIPNQLYLRNTIKSEEWFKKDDMFGEEEVGVVYHFLHDSIDFELEEYLNFISKFPSDCEHIISHSKLTNDTMFFKAAGISTLKLKTIQNDHFNLPYSEDYKPDESTKAFHKLHSLQQFEITTDGVNIDDSLIVKDNWSTLYDTEIAPLNLEGVKKEEIVETEPISLKPIDSSSSLKDSVQIVTLGTGSALPTIYRNVISTLVRVPYQNKSGQVEFRSILLDGGENTIGAMMRNFGHNNRAQLNQIFQELCLIHLSHLHADHHLGIISIINEWFKINHDSTKKLYLIVPWQYNNFVTEWYDVERPTEGSNIDLDRIVYISCENFIKDPVGQIKQVDLNTFERNYENQQNSLSREQFTKNNELSQLIYEQLGIKNIQTVRAIHCYWAYSISLTFDLGNNETFKVSYSGDTRPNPRFVEIGYGSDLLIHESSLNNQLVEEAIAKKHSTMIEAIKVSQLMNCRKLILTHFSARFTHGESICSRGEKLEKLSDDLAKYLTKYSVTPNIFSFKTNRPIIEKSQDVEVCCAFDLMTIRYKTLHAQQEKVGQILNLFPIDDDDETLVKKDNEKRESKRTQRLKRNPSKKRRTSSDEDQSN